MVALALEASACVTGVDLALECVIVAFRVGLGVSDESWTRLASSGGVDSRFALVLPSVLK